MTIPEGWIETTLGDEIEIIGGGTPKTSIPEYWNGDIPWISIVDINNVNRWLTNTEKTITNEGLMNSSTKILNSGDLIISARGTVGEFAQIKKPMAFNQSCYGLRAKSNTINNFLYYLLKSYLSQIKKKSHGAVFDTITKETFDNIVIYLPPLSEQKEIADILSSFDDKIELLQEENKTLEAIAQNIFKEWFVNFNFPDENGKPYKSSGRKMITSELGEIPEGWRVGKLGNVDFLLFGDGNYSSKYPKQSDFHGEGIPFISNKDLRNGTIVQEGLRYISPEQHKELRKGHLKKRDILISTRANIGDIALVPAKYENSNINAQLVYIRSNNPALYSGYLYLIFKSTEYRKIFEGFSSGSAQSQLPINALKRVPIVIPNEVILSKFSKIGNCLLEKLEANLSQIQTVSSLRDEVLPKLIDGRLRIKFRSFYE